MIFKYIYYYSVVDPYLLGSRTLVRSELLDPENNGTLTRIKCVK
jgi:hypothetical protein